MEMRAAISSPRRVNITGSFPYATLFTISASLFLASAVETVLSMVASYMYIMYISYTFHGSLSRNYNKSLGGGWGTGIDVLIRSHFKASDGV